MVDSFTLRFSVFMLRMMFTANQIILFLVTVMPLVGGQKPTWPTSACPFIHHEEMIPRGGEYTGTTTSSESACEEVCAGDARCGSYGWYKPAGFCALYQMTPALMERLTGIPGHVWNKRQPGYNMAAKDCDAVVSETNCSSYSVSHDRSSPHGAYRMSHLYTPPPRSLAAAGCQKLCDAQEGCESVLYYTRPSGMSFCSLYNVTITELLATGREGQVYTNTDRAAWPTHITYDCEFAPEPTTLTLRTITTPPTTAPAATISSTTASTTKLATTSTTSTTKPTQKKGSASASDPIIRGSSLVTNSMTIMTSSLAGLAIFIMVISIWYKNRKTPCMKLKVPVLSPRCQDRPSVPLSSSYQPAANIHTSAECVDTTGGDNVWPVTLANL